MAIKIITAAAGLLTVKVSGKLKKSELDKLQKAAIDVISAGANVRCLVLAEAFEGWDKSGNWGDIDFQMKYDQKIERIAIVGPKLLEDEISAFVASGLRPVDIQYFLPGQLAQARLWVAR
jgi:hypothetical protein